MTNKKNAKNIDKNKSTEWAKKPVYQDLKQAYEDTFKTKTKIRNDLPIIIYVSSYNGKLNNAWLSDFVASDEAYSLISYFFYGQNRGHIFSKATGSSRSDKDKPPGMDLFKEK